jgi:hypothetical protein
MCGEGQSARRASQVSLHAPHCGLIERREDFVNPAVARHLCSAKVKNGFITFGHEVLAAPA